MSENRNIPSPTCLHYPEGGCEWVGERGGASIPRQLVKLLHEVYGREKEGARKIDGHYRARGTHRYARRRLGYQLAAYRLLVFDICFPFVRLIEASPCSSLSLSLLGASPGRTLLFSGNENCPRNLFPHRREIPRET